MASTFLIAFAFSFIGSIPPGSINLSIVQLSTAGKFDAAIRFALAAALVELPYAFIALQFEQLITSSMAITDQFKLIAALVMLALGVINLWPSKKVSSPIIEKIKNSGFRKGVVISLFNPLAIPFWIGITAYLKNQNWIQLTSSGHTISYLAGISLGTFFLLAILAFIGKKVGHYVKDQQITRWIPGLVFLVLGSYALLQYLNLL